MMKLLGLFFVVSMVLSVPAFSTTTEEINTRLDQLYGSHKKYHTFFDDFQAEISKGDKQKVANRISYPLKSVKIKGKNVIIWTKSQFIKNYNQIITFKIKKAILDQQFENLFARDQGIMIGNHGEVWISGICSGSKCTKKIVKVITINN